MQDLQQLETSLASRPFDDRTGVGALLHAATAPPRQQRRLPERILAAAHQACDIGELDAADRLLSVLDTTLAHDAVVTNAAHRRVVEGMVAAYERLWHLRRPIQA